MLNLEYRFLESSSDCGWSSVWFDYAADFQEGMEKLKNPNLEGILEKEGMVIALTTEKNKTLVVGKVCSGVVKYINDYESTFAKGEFITSGSVYLGATNKTLIEFWKYDRHPASLLSFIGHAQMGSRNNVYFEIQLEAIEYAQKITGATSNVVESAKRIIQAYVIGIIDHQKFIKELKRLNIYYGENNEILRSINNRIIDMIAVRKPVGLTTLIIALNSYKERNRLKSVDVEKDMSKIIKSHITLAGAIEDIIFYNDSTYGETER